uniref:Rho-GAP domain-containing protein n=1 Tax=Angiostrongylus cantonensis TaxID=6313 RepID=A0A0K0CZS8_ANGCA
MSTIIEQLLLFRTVTSFQAASLASSSSTPSERNGHTASATNQLIMHRYKAKSTQLQSPVSAKRTIVNDVHCAQPSTSKDSSSGENGEPSTPKSGHKWKKLKAGKQGSGGGSSSVPTGVSGSGSTSNAAGSITGMPTPQNILGIRLADCLTSGPEDLVPLVVRICVSVVEANGLDTVGIYRIPGNTAAVNTLKETLSHCLDIMTLEKTLELIDANLYRCFQMDLSDPRWRDVNVVSSFLKMFLRKLPEPLLTDKLYPFFIDANRISNHHNRLHKIRNLLRKLPRHHYATLRYLIDHLSAITRNSKVNKMETRNLALMFGPSIVRPSDDNMATMVTHMSDQCKIIETLIHYNEWMFDEKSTASDIVPERHPSDTSVTAMEAPQYGVGVPSGVSAASFNDMHNLIRKANEDQAAAMMSEGKTGKRQLICGIFVEQIVYDFLKCTHDVNMLHNSCWYLQIKNILRRNSRRDKSKSKLKIESTAPAAVNPRVVSGSALPNTAHQTANQSPQPQSPIQRSCVETTFCGNYQERDIDAEIISRQTVSPLGAVASTGALEQSPSIESSLGSIPDTSRTDPGTRTTSPDISELQARRKRQQDIYSARRIFIAGSAEAADDASAVDALANHTQHLNMANSPALEVLSEETREKIRKMQRRQNWMDPLSLMFTSSVIDTSHPSTTEAIEPPCFDLPSTTQSEPLKTSSPTKDTTDALSCTSDYSTTSSAPLTAPLAVACAASYSDYASSFSDPSPCARNASSSPRQRPQVLAVLTEARCQQKIRSRNRSVTRDPIRRHTLSDVDVLKSSPDVSAQHSLGEEENLPRKPLPCFDPPVIVRTSPNELTPASGDELL